jgi:hypothetical protein
MDLRRTPCCLVSIDFDSAAVIQGVVDEAELWLSEYVGSG